MEQEKHQNKYCESETPHFFKVILHDTLESKKLVFPKIFARKHGRHLSLDKVYLKISSGDAWEVELHKGEDGGLCLLDGWQDFVEFYNIKFGHFLVFGYLGNSEFQVLIFDNTTSEIKYPCKAKDNEEQNAHVVVEPCLSSSKPEMEESNVEILVESDVEILVDHNTFNTKKRKNSAKHMAKRTKGISKSFTPKKTRQDSETVTRSTVFDHRNPYFQLTMRASYVNEMNFLWLPNKFMRDHVGQKLGDMKLSVPHGRFWTVKCYVITHGKRPGARLHQGWRHFVRDNNLAEGDVCVFELIDSVNVHFQVNIFRAGKDPSSNRIPGGECSYGWISQKPSHHEVSGSGNPSFKILMTEARMRRMAAPIQTGFAKHLKNGEFVTLDVGGRLWRVKVCFYRRNSGKESIFSSGWGDFVRGNSLQAGDTCIFELIDRIKMVLKVTIHRAST